MSDFDILLTPEEVAQMLRIHVRTVHDHRKRLGGFYPAGIKVLRFRRDVIESFIEGPERERLDAHISNPKRPRGTPFVNGKPPRKGGKPWDPHGLLDGSKHEKKKPKET